MDDGVVIEQGRHDELLEADGIYASMWRVQTGERHGPATPA
jgi:ATP-binding cassette, subfamily B, bacterial